MLNKKRVLIFSTIFLFVIISPSLSAEKNFDEVIQNLEIKIDGTNVLRSGDEIII